jgi:hypothetical protein
MAALATRAVASDQCVDFARDDLKAHAGQRGSLAIAAASVADAEDHCRISRHIRPWA